jgi:hypothetical protein
MSNYFGGYYLIQLKKFDFGRLKDKLVYTCSDCINDSLFGSWSLSWTTKGNDELVRISNDFKINEGTISEINTWADKNFNDKKVGWINVFSDLHAVKEYRSRFFSHVNDLKVLCIYFADTEVNDIMETFMSKGTNGALGIWQNLSLRISETDDMNEVLIGYDLIGIESGGEFHSLHCHDIADELSNKFGVTFNKYGLMEERSDWGPLTEYMNDEENGLEPVPWYVCKVKMRLDA